MSRMGRGISDKERPFLHITSDFLHLFPESQVFFNNTQQGYGKWVKIIQTVQLTRYFGSSADMPGNVIQKYIFVGLTLPGHDMRVTKQLNIRKM